MARYCDEIRPLVASRTFLTGPDLGTYEEDFAPIRDREDRRDCPDVGRDGEHL
jgi:hypothetical protein